MPSETSFTPKKPWLSGLLLLGLLLGSVLQPVLLAHALTETVNLKRLGVEEDLIYLPTIRAQRELTFTRPRDWNISGAKAIVEFQHSEQLIDGSWLQVIVNDKVLKHQPLTKANVTGTKLDVAIPPGILQDFNRLIIRVEQHYSKKCEDPVDPSLWTNVLNTSKVEVSYSKKPPALTFTAFPYPVVDTLAYKPVPLRYVVPTSAGSNELQALGLLNVLFAQEQPKNAIAAHAQTSEQALPAADENVVLIGTASSLNGSAQALLSQAKFSGFSLQGGQWVGTGGQSLGSGDGLVALAPHPKKTGYVILVVSGNSPEGVLKAAQALASRQKELLTAAGSLVIPASFAPAGGGLAYPPYIENESRTLAELGFGIQSVEKITAPPITLDVPVVTDFSNPNTQLMLNLNYSYSPKLNPKYSALELRLNDRSFANIPLTNETMGEDRASVQVPIPRDLLKTGNKFVAQFHLMPDKYGFCVDKYEDETFGKIHEDSRFMVQSAPASKLPDVSLLSLGRGYPYTLRPDLSETQILLSAVNPAQLDTLLAVTSRLGRYSSKAVASQLSVGVLGQQSTDGGKHVVLIDQAGALEGGLQQALSVTSQAAGNTTNVSWKGQKTSVAFNEASGRSAALMEMGLTGGNKVITRLSAPTASGLALLANVWNDEVAFSKLPEGKIIRVAGQELTVSVDERKEPPQLTTSAAGMTASGAAVKVTGGGLFGWWNALWANTWFQWMTYALLGLFGLFFALPLLLNLFRGKR